MATPCYKGPNPIKDDERPAIWRWAKENGVDAGLPIDQIGKSINDHFYGGQAKPEWINDILSGRKTPFRNVASEMWRKQYNRRVITQQAAELSRLHSLGPVGKWLRKLWTLPRTVAVAGHGVVFPITHAGDLAFSPTRWGTFIKGTLRTYRAAPELWGLGSKLGGGKAYAGRVLASMESDAMFDTAMRAGVDVGPASHPSGLISRSYHGPAQRAWDMLTVMRYELWKKQMSKYVKPGMSETEVMDIGKNLADWANHATGSGKGPVSKLGGEVLFGPKLTQSKLNRISVDPIKTVKTFSDWNGATAGERAVAMTRLSGSVQYLITNLGFLAVNAGVLAWAKSKDKINYTDPTRGDFMSFKGAGILGNVPGMHTEVKMLAKVLATAFMSKRELHGESKFEKTAKIAGQYGMAKLTPTLQRGMELGFGQDWMGRPLPWSKEPGTAKKPRLSYGEYAADIGPIPLSGPIGFTYDQLKKSGASSMDATAITKALIIGGLGAPGFHVREDFAHGKPLRYP